MFSIKIHIFWVDPIQYTSSIQIQKIHLLILEIFQVGQNILEQITLLQISMMLFGKSYSHQV